MRAGRRGQGGTDLERRRAAELQVLGEDVRGVDEEVRPEVGRRLVADLLEVLLQFFLGVPPGEVGVGLLEAGPAQSVHHGRAGERLGEEDDVGVLLVDLADQPFPEPDGFGVRVVHPEDLDAVADPEQHDPQDFVGQPCGVVVEVQRENVLVLLRRILRVGDAAVHAGGEPFRVALHPRVVRRGLQRQVQGHFESQLTGPRHEGVEVLEGAQVRVDGVVAALVGADGPRRAGIVRSGDQGVVRALAVLDADRVDRRHVDDVEAHGGDGVEALARRCGSCRRSIPRCRGCARHLRSGGRIRTRRRGRRASRSTSSGYGSETVTSSRMGWRSTTAATSALKPAARRSSGVRDGVGQDDDGHPQRPAVSGRAGGVLGRFGEQGGAFGQHQLDVDAGLHLDLGVVVPGAVAVVPGLDDEGPVAGGGRGQEAFPAVGAHAARSPRRGEADALALFAAGIEEDGADAELVVALPEGGGAHHDGFARHGLGGELPALDRQAARR